METINFKRLYTNNIRNSYKKVQQEIALHEENIQNITAVLEAVKKSGILGDTYIPVQMSENGEFKTIIIDNSNKNAMVAKLKEHLKEEKNYLQELQDQARRYLPYINLLNKRPFMEINGNPIYPIIDVIVFSLNYHLPLKGVIETINMIIHFNGKFLNNNNYHHKNLSQLDYEIMDLMRFMSSYYNEEGQIVNVTDYRQYGNLASQFYSLIITYLCIVQKPLMLKHGLELTTLIDGANDQLEDYIQKINQVKAVASEEQIKAPVIHKVNYTDLEKLKPYLRHGEIIAPLDPKEFTQLLLSAGYTVDEAIMYANKMQDFISDNAQVAKKDQIVLAQNELFTKDELKLYQSLVDSTDPAVSQIISELQTIIDLYLEDPNIREELIEDKEFLMNSLQAYAKPEEIPLSPLFYVDENLCPIFQKEYDKLPKQDQKRVLSLIDKITNKNIKNSFRPILGIKKAPCRLSFLTIGKIKVTFAEYDLDKYVILAVGSGDTAINMTQKIANSNAFSQFLTDLKNPTYLAEINKICNEQYTKMQSLLSPRVSGPQPIFQNLESNF